jgi:hypothetical protein
MTGRKSASIAVLALSLFSAQAAQASPITFTANSGTRSASVTFADSGGDLIVTLTNTSSADSMVPIDILTGVFFSSSNANLLTSLSALLGPGSMVFDDPDGQPAGGVVGGEWAYLAGLVGAPGGATRGISSSGLGLFGGATFPGDELGGPDNGALDGLQYGIVTAGDLAGTGNTGLLKGEGLIQNSVVFVLGNWGGADASTAFSNVSFQYGTALDEPNIPENGGGGITAQAVPEPASLVLLGSGLAAVAVRRRRVRRN